MAEYLAPGVYVEEVERGATPLGGVSMSTAGFLGPTERGPTDPRLLTSFADFERAYGGYLADSYLADAVSGFFSNGGSRCFVGRVTGEDDENATGSIPLERPSEDRLETLLGIDDDELEFGAVSDGDHVTKTITLRHEGGVDDDDIEIVLEDAATLETTMDDSCFSYEWADGTSDTETQTIESGDEGGAELDVTFEPIAGVWSHWARLTIDPGNDIALVSATLVGENADESAADLLTAEEAQLDYGVLDDDDRTLRVTAVHAGGDVVEIDADESTIIGPDSDQFSIDTTGTVEVGDAADVDATAELDVTFDPDDVAGGRRATLLVDHDGDNAPLVVTLTGWNREAMNLDAVGPGAWGDHVAVFVEDASMYDPGTNELFKLVLRYWSDDDDYADAKAGGGDPNNDDVPPPDVEEVYDDLSPDESSSNFYVQQINGVSMLVTLEKDEKGRPDPGAGPVWLDGGETTEIEREDFVGDAKLPPEERTGFAGFEKLDEISIVCVPDEHEYDVTDPLIEHCHAMDDRFAILQAEQNPGPVGDLKPPDDTDMAAFYYPWLEVVSPITGIVEPVPPGGHIAGIYARSDANHGVHKAPANEVVRGIEGIQRTITKGEQEVLNPRGVNCIRAFRGRGIRVWGARTASSNPNWKYVNVRRLFLFLRGSIEEGTQWVVFEPNNEQLWARVRQTIKNFLTDVWEDGALMGTSPDEAFFVKCDRSTMTQSDIENGRLICEIGVAPVRPAEFVVFRISQWTGSAD